MSFFQSDVVRAEMAEIHELQEEVYSNVFKFPTMKREDQKYHVDICLLYTSPSPRDMRRSRMPSSA